MKNFLKSMNLAGSAGSISGQNFDSARDGFDGIIDQNAAGPGIELGTSRIMTDDGNHPDSVANMHTSQASIPQSERRRIGRVHKRDAALDDVVAKEMARIQRAFDQRVVDHTEEMISKVQKGEPLVAKADPTPAAGKKR